MKLELAIDSRLDDPTRRVIGEATASQLPGRQNGGAADAYRHILLSAELTRDYGFATAFDVLVEHERDKTGGADNGLDMWNNAIGMKIGQYVRDNGGIWEDVVRLSRSVMVETFSTRNFNEVSTWPTRNASDGIKRAYDDYRKLNPGRRRHGFHSNPGFQPLSFKEFAKDFNQTYQFRSTGQSISLDGGKLVVNSAAMTSPKHWAKHPTVTKNGKTVELTVAKSVFPDIGWFQGQGFVYEKDNPSPKLSFSPKQHAISNKGTQGAAGTKSGAAGTGPALKPGATLEELRKKGERSGESDLNGPEGKVFEVLKRRKRTQYAPRGPRTRYARSGAKAAGDGRSPARGGNPFSLNDPDLRRQAEIVEQDPRQARKLILAAKRRPELFNL
jgi:hypothetical protein